uniref:Pyridoxal kinase n=1 Tax=Strongyloides papillosus TaxID=174720 RepID=A0A0N5BWN1_STREA
MIALDRLKVNKHSKRVLSIQSHVVSGYAGNKCSVFPLQLNGFEVDVINSVQFSNHTGYEHVRGQRLASSDLKDIFEGLKLNDLINYSHIVTGYVGKVDFLKEIKEIVLECKKINPDLIYVCDPVMGDCGEYYTPKELMPVYRDEIISLADVITPNAFELGELTGIPIESEESCLKAIDILHKKYAIKYIVISSGVMHPTDENIFYAYASKLTENGQYEQYRFKINKIDIYCVGTGDVFVSLLINWMDVLENDIQQAVCNTISTLQHILQKTNECCEDKSLPQDREIKLIQSRFEILFPTIKIETEKI